MISVILPFFQVIKQMNWWFQPIMPAVIACKQVRKVENTKEAINWRRTYNTMTKRQLLEEHTMIYRTLHKTLKIEIHEFHKTKGKLWTGKPFLFHEWYPSSYSCYKPIISHEWGKNRETEVSRSIYSKSINASSLLFVLSINTVWK